MNNSLFSPRKLRVSRGVSVLAIGAAIYASQAVAQTEPPTDPRIPQSVPTQDSANTSVTDVAQNEPETARPTIRISQEPPPGFEDMDDELQTLFDITFAGRRLGSTPAVLQNGEIRFLDPEGLARLLPERVDRRRFIETFSESLASNQGLRCLPGRTTGCGTLPPGQFGVIVYPERFQADLFLSQEFFSEVDDSPIFLGEPISGPSLIQSALVSLNTARGDIGRVQFGATLDTIASVGRTSLVAQTLVRDDGANLQRFFGQRYWRERRAAAGLLQDDRSLTFRSYRLVGAEFGSFFNTRMDAFEGASTPIEIVLPRNATVEIFREDVLIQTIQLDAGLQTIDTRNFPSGSYPVRIVASDGGQIILEEVRTFTRVSGLPPEGKTAFNLRLGVRAEDSFAGGFGFGTTTDRPFFPDLTGEELIAASAARKIGTATAVSVQTLFVGGQGFAEAGLITTRNRISGVAALSAGTDGSYSALLNGTVRLMDIDFNLSARHTRNDGEFDLVGPRREDFEPYFRSEDIVTASASLRVAGGNLSLTSSYSRSPRLDDRYSVGIRYNRPLNIDALGGARLSVFGIQSTNETRVGVSISFFRRLSPNTTAFFGGGLEYRDRDEGSALNDGIFPVADARISRSYDWGTSDILAQAGVSTDADRHRAFVAADLASNLGLVDVVADYEERRGAGGNSGFGISANMFTGFTVGSGEFRAGLRDPGGEAAVSVSIDRSGMPEALADGLDDSGLYKVIVDNQEIGEFAPDGSTTIVLPSFDTYSIQIQPEQAPPYLIDLTRREVPLYPGNVVNLSYDAQFAITAFGRLVDAEGKPTGAARVSAGTDTTVTDQSGYFLITAALNEELQIFDAEGRPCKASTLRELYERQAAEARQSYLRLGDIRCELN